MEPSPANLEYMRLMLSEQIPDGGVDADTLVTDQDLTTMLMGASNFNEALISGWEIKLAAWSNLVDVTDGASSRKLGDLMEHAQTMIAYYRKKITAGPGEVNRTRTRIGKIIRSE